MIPTCATCRFWNPDYVIEPQPSETGDCHRMPPQVYVVHDDIYPKLDSAEKGIAWRRGAVWPETQHSDWCGEYLKRNSEGLLPTLPPNTETVMSP